MSIYHHAILLAGLLLVFTAHLFAALFEHARIPDVLPLMIMGLMIGPIFHAASSKSLGRMGDMFSMVALVIILFQGGLEFQLSHLKESLGPGVPGFRYLIFLAASPSSEHWPVGDCIGPGFRRVCWGRSARRRLRRSSSLYRKNFVWSR